MNQSITNLKSEWDSHHPLSQENDRRLWQKLRLEWNYHSNHIEGNTLTYGETELLLIHGQTHGNHTLREYEEMQAHDVGIAHLRELASDQSRLIGETDIRGLNKIILKEPFWKPAQTAEGKPSRKQIIPGEYKTTPNNVITATGELFEFTTPSDVPARMRALVEWLGDSLHRFLDADLLGLIVKLHHDFVLIHPFDDGNGRVARMLVNYVLMRQGYPPIIVPTERKKDYLAALRLADAGDITELEDFLGTCVIRSLELGIKAAKGERLDEPGDVEKEIELFKRSQEHHREKVKPPSTEAVRQLYETGFQYLILRVVEKMKIFDDLFVRSKMVVEPQLAETKGDPVATFEQLLNKGIKANQKFILRFNYEGFRGEASSPFGVGTVVELCFDKFEYHWAIGNRALIRKLYSETVLKDEAEQFVDAVQKVLFEAIKKHSKQK
ncbi:MAG: Fic family protein [Luteolibacter sp.]